MSDEEQGQDPYLVENGLQLTHASRLRPVEPKSGLSGDCFGVRSERRLCEEVHLDLGYRWFCRLDLGDTQTPFS